MNLNIKNPFNIKLSNQEHFILRSCEENYTPFGLAVERKFEIFSEDMKLVGTLNVKCSEENGHEIVKQNFVSAAWVEAADCLTEKDFRAAVANVITVYKTNRYY